MTVRALPWAIQGQSHEAEIARDFVAAITGSPVQTVTPAVTPTGVGGGHGVVFSGDGQLAVTQNGTPNMSVNVAAGRAFIRHTATGSLDAGVYVFMNDGTVNVAIAAADATNPRRDLVVAQVRDSNYSGGSNDARLTVVQGTPAASPVDPTVPANSLVLARVAVGAGVTSIVTANITDLRTRAFALGGGQDVQVFAADGTWTKPAWATATSTVTILCVGAGGGGGSGRRGAAGTARGGGGGGGGGGWATVTVLASALAATEPVFVGIAGAGGVAATLNDQSGIPGGAGGASSFGSTALVAAMGGNGGPGGILGPGSSLSAAGGASVSYPNAGNGGSDGATAGAGDTLFKRGPGWAGGGGGGGGITSGNVFLAGGSGNLGGAGNPAGAGGATAGAIGSNGASAPAGATIGGCGGGGGAGNPAGAGGTGGAGGAYGGGGGGGGASVNGSNSGAGGTGGNGLVIVVTRQ